MKRKTNNYKNDKNEVVWQIALKNFIDENHNQFVSQNGKQISIFSIGEHNKFEGPDFKNACIQMNENMIIGDIEFHKKTSDWIKHNHSADPNYNNVILHIVFQEDKFFRSNFETILLNRKQLEPYQNKKQNLEELENDECKYLSILRLLMKTKNVSNLLKIDSIDNVFFALLTDFLIRYSNFRTRHFNSEIDLSRIFSLLQNSYLYNCICKKRHQYLLDINVLFKEFIEETNLGDINRHLKQEILTNVILPIAFSVATDSIKVQLLLWYRSAKTRTKYGILKRFYPNVEQKYIWQQQGMLEHHKNSYQLQLPNDSNINTYDIEYYLYLFDALGE